MSAAGDMFGKAVDLRSTLRNSSADPIKIMRRSCVRFTRGSMLRMRSVTSKMTPTWALSIGPRRITFADST